MNFMNFLQQDPTISEIRDDLPTGNYTDWIINVYLKNKMPESSIITIGEPLQYFHKHRRSLNKEDKNIFNFSSVQELDKQLMKYDWYSKKLGLSTRKEVKEKLKYMNYRIGK